MLLFKVINLSQGGAGLIHQSAKPWRSGSPYAKAFMEKITSPNNSGSPGRWLDFFQ